MRKAWHRSFSFWFGMLVLSFLMWVWVDSFFNYSFMRIPRTGSIPGSFTRFRSGVIAVQWREWTGKPREFYGPFAFNRRNFPARDSPWRAEHWGMSHERRSAWVYTGPHGLTDDEELRRMDAGENAPYQEHTRRYPFWMVIAAYLVLWGLAMWFRHRWLQKRGSEPIKMEDGEDSDFGAKCDVSPGDPKTPDQQPAIRRV